MKQKTLFILVFFMLLRLPSVAQHIFNMADYGIVPGNSGNLSQKMETFLKNNEKSLRDAEQVILRFQKGVYHFHPKQAAEREYYISNHDQINPKKVGIALEQCRSLILEGNGAQFVFHGQMLPIALIGSSNCVLKDFSIDFENPHIAQIEIVRNDSSEGMTFRVAPWVKYRISKDGFFETYGEGWTSRPALGFAFEKETKHVVFNTGDLGYSTKGVKTVGKRLLTAPLWKDKRLIPGTIVAMRSWKRPAPGLFLAENKNTVVKNVRVHYAEGMGLLAQLCEDIRLEGFSVCLKGKEDARYFTTQADATHFSQCKGRIVSTGGLYEGMMDDAINVHGVYLKIQKVVDAHTVTAAFMHEQTYGFDFGYAGDSVQFIRSKTMDVLPEKNIIASISPIKPLGKNKGVKTFTIRFQKPIDNLLNKEEAFGIENLTWTPEIYFAHNTIRNNRGRGALFSSPEKTLVEENLFDHTSGTAILLCGDCNGWYETGSCRDVTIRNNRFINALTSLYQFTNAVISIYPEIPDLLHQTTYFHGGTPQAIKIVNNQFDTFDSPVLYAKSVDGLLFKGNTIKRNHDYKPFHWNHNRFLLERVNRVEISE